MILVSESCYGRQRISLKIVIHSRVRFTHISKYAIFHGRWITLSSSAHTYVYDLHLIAPKFKAIR